MKKGVIMLQGTGSNVGKSVLVAALCRVLKQDGYSVAPFKAQNMALNSFVTADGCEIGRAQAFQAEACGIEPTVEMNPVLLKPTGEKGSQVIVMGKSIGNMAAVDYYQMKKDLLGTVKDAYFRLKGKHDTIVIEGAGSPAEINLKNDFSNMGIAREVEAPVIIVGDIDCGGVFAWMKGTFDLLKEDEKELVKGFIINKFRGDRKLLEPGIAMFEEMVGRKVVGVVPYLKDIYLDAEDSQDLEGQGARGKEPEKESLISPSTQNPRFKTQNPPIHQPSDSIVISVIKLPRISNFTDFAPLSRESGVTLRFAERPSQLEGSDCVILPGSKNSIEDMTFLERNGFRERITKLSSQGVLIVGICGGFQMLGETISDDEGHESRIAECCGFGLLPIVTKFHREKTLLQTKVTTKESPFFPAGLEIPGYEIHMGRSTKTKEEGVAELFEGETSEVLGLCNNKGSVLGTYLHDFFHHDDLRAIFVNRLREQKGLETQEKYDFQSFKEAELDRLALCFRENIDMAYLKSLLQ